MKDVGSEAIRLFERGKFSHVDIVLPGGDLLGARDDAYKGIAPGVQIRPPDYAAFSDKLVVTIECSEQEEADFYAFAHQQIGKPYDSTAILGFIFNRDWRAPDSWFCSELAAASLEASKLLLYPLVTTVNKIVPEDLLLVCSVLTEA